MPKGQLYYSFIIFEKFDRNTAATSFKTLSKKRYQEWGIDKLKGTVQTSFNIQLELKLCWLSTKSNNRK